MSYVNTDHSNWHPSTEVYTSAGHKDILSHVFTHVLPFCPLLPLLQSCFHSKARHFRTVNHSAKPASLHCFLWAFRLTSPVTQTQRAQSSKFPEISCKTCLVAIHQALLLCKRNSQGMYSLQTQPTAEFPWKGLHQHQESQTTLHLHGPWLGSQCQPHCQSCFHLANHRTLFRAQVQGLHSVCNNLC